MNHLGSVANQMQVEFIVRIKQNELIDAFMKYYAQSTLKLLHCDTPLS
jgi:hypothetical protein